MPADRRHRFHELLELLGSEEEQLAYERNVPHVDVNAFYDVRKKRLPASQGTVRTWLASPVWREVMEQARRTREKLA